MTIAAVLTHSSVIAVQVGWLFLTFVSQSCKSTEQAELSVKIEERLRKGSILQRNYGIGATILTCAMTIAAWILDLHTWPSSSTLQTAKRSNVAADVLPVKPTLRLVGPHILQQKPSHEAPCLT